MIIFTKEEDERKRLGRPDYELLFPTTNGFWHVHARAHTLEELEDWAEKNTDPMMNWKIAHIVQFQG